MSKLHFEKTALEGVYVIEPKVFGDARGFFMETYSRADFEEVGLDYTFVQDNQSFSGRGILRGLHYQKNFPQTKLVRVISGEVFDVAVDIRTDSPTRGQWVGRVLSGENKLQLLIPRGFAHGFLVLSEMAEFAYKCDEFYHPEDEGCVRWDDPTLAIRWPDCGCVPLLSEKDKNAPQWTVL